MQPTRKTQAQAIAVAGITIRTTNAAEFNPATGKIAGLWGRFFSEGLFDTLPGKLAESPVYGVYSNYESDYLGAFDVTAGVATTQPEGQLALQAGTYLVFKGAGPMPQTVLQTWGTVWQYFQSNPDVKRTYCTDYEAYLGTDTVEIHIGVQA